LIRGRDWGRERGVRDYRNPGRDSCERELRPLVDLDDGLCSLALKAAKAGFLHRQEDRAQIADIGPFRRELVAQRLGALDPTSELGFGQSGEVALYEVAVHGGAS
jgi:hypothetical protein